MMNVDSVQQFIKSHKARLEHEKDKLEDRSGGILPQDSSARVRERLKRERQSDYQEHLRKQLPLGHSSSHTSLLPPSSSGGLNTHSVPHTRSSGSLVEKRRLLAQERDREISSQLRQRFDDRVDHSDTYHDRERGGGGGGGGGRDEGEGVGRGRARGGGGGGFWRGEGERDGGGGGERGGRRGGGGGRDESKESRSRQDYLRERRLEEERKFGGGYFHETFSPAHQNQRKTRGHRDGEGEGGRRSDGEGATSRQVRFEDLEEEDTIYKTSGLGSRQPRKRWEEEEEHLMQWARGQKSRGTVDKKSRTPTPPKYGSSLHHKQTLTSRGSRSISAPVVGGGFGAGFGGEDLLEEKRRKQREYAAELQAQMREKEEAKDRERGTERRGGRRGGMLEREDRVEEEREEGFGLRQKYFSKENKSILRQDRDSGGSYSTHSQPQYIFRSQHHAALGPSSSPTPPPASYPPLPPNWPHPYYGGYPYPHPPPHHSSYPPPPPPPHPNSYPYYLPPPPPPSMPPSLANPYLQYYQQTNHDSEPHRTSPRRLKDDGNRQEHSNYNFNDPRYEETKGDSTSPQYFSTSGESEGKGSKISKEAYRAQLVEQMMEKQNERARERLRREESERKLEQEIYDPFGKGGCGAPIRDTRGHLVTDLKQMKKVNDVKQRFGLSSVTPLPGGSMEGGGGAGILDESLNSQISPRFIASRDAQRSKEVRSKSGLGDYREALEKQMKEKEDLKKREKEKKAQEEKEEADRIEKEAKRLEEDYRKEKEREKEKQYELKLKNEMMKREKEEKIREEEERKLEEEWREQQELREEAERKKQALIDKMERQAPIAVQRVSYSPPIPTLRHKAGQGDEQMGLGPPQPQTHNPTTAAPLSPPVPAVYHKIHLGQVQHTDIHTHPSFDNTHVTTSQLQQEYQYQPRCSSPPVPAVQNKLAQQQQQQQQQGEHNGITSDPSRPPPPASHNPPTLSYQRQPMLPTEPTSTPHPLPVASSFSHHPMPPPPLPSLSATSSSSHAILPPHFHPLPTTQSGQPAQLPEDQAESVARHLQRMRRMLENERQKIAIQSLRPAAPVSLPPTITQHNADGGDSSSSGISMMRAKDPLANFVRPRLVAPRRSHAGTSDSTASGNESESVAYSTAPNALHQQGGIPQQSGSEVRVPFHIHKPLKSQSFPKLHSGSYNTILHTNPRQTGKENTQPQDTPHSLFQQDTHTPHTLYQQHHQGPSWLNKPTSTPTPPPPRHFPPPPWLSSKDKPTATHPSLPPPHPNHQQQTMRHRAPSAGGQSHVSVNTLDVDSMSRRNEERMQRLEAILNAQSHDTRPSQNIINDIMTRNNHSEGGRGREPQLMHTSTSDSQTRSGDPQLMHTSSFAGQRRDRGTRSVDDAGSELDCETGYQPISSTPT